jgi:hypothetical protein
MSDTMKPDKRITSIVSSVTSHTASAKHNDKPESGMGTGLELPDSPARDDKAPDKPKDSQELLRTVFAGIAIIVSVYALAVSSGSRDAAQESARNAKRSADAAQRNADTAEKALKTTTENFQLDQRARMGVREVKVPTGEVKEGMKWAFKVNAINNGKTSAQSTKSIVATSLILKDDPFTSLYSEGPFAPNTRSIGVVPPGGPVSAPTREVELTRVQSDAFTQGTATSYVYGEFSYDDVFGKPHCITYCFYFIANFSDANVCSTYNQETDTKCENIKW